MINSRFLSLEPSLFEPLVREFCFFGIGISYARESLEDGTFMYACI